MMGSLPVNYESTFHIVALLKACTTGKDLGKGSKLHAYIREHKCLGKNIYVGNALISMYAKCGALSKAQQVLNELPFRNGISWNALIAGYAQPGQGEEALKCFDDMIREGHSPTVITFICILKACGSIRATAKGEEIHDKLVSLCMLEKHIVLGTTLLDMYVKCGAVAKAHRVHEELPIHDVVSWGALIAGYSQQGDGEEALKCFNDMLYEGHFPSEASFACALKACGSIGALAKGKEIHDKIVSLGLLEKNIVLATTLVDMYVKCGALAKAEQVHRGLPIRDVVSWSALIAGYTQQGQGEEALKSFDDMLHDGHSPTAVTFMCALKACGSIGSVCKGKEIHDKIISLGMLEKDLVLGSFLVDMYVKCGDLATASQVLEELSVCDVVSWSALLSGYAQQGFSMEVINCFERMLSNGVKPDLVSLTVVLNTCTYSGLLDQAETYFSRMSTKYGFHPNLEQYYCMADLFGRAGKFNKALSVIAEMPYDKRFSCWVALLGACHKWAEVKIGRLVFEQALHLDKSNAAVYILMADIYGAAGLQEEALKIEVMGVSNKAWNMPDVSVSMGI